MVAIAVRLLAFVALLLGIWAAGDWLATPRLPEAALDPDDKALPLQLFPLLALQISNILRGGTLVVAYAIYAISAGAIVLSVLLSAWLAWRGLQRTTVRYLVLALALGSLAVAYFWFFRELQPYRQMLSTARPVLDYVGMAAGLLALMSLVACFRSYPEPFAREMARLDFEAGSSKRIEQAARVRRGDGLWRFWSWLPSEHYGNHGRRQSPGLRGVARALRSRELIWIVAFACIALAGFAWSPVMSDGHPGFRAFFWSAVATLVLIFLDPTFGVRCEEMWLFRWMHESEHTSLFNFEMALHRFFGGPVGMAVAVAAACALTWFWHRDLAASAALTALLLVVTVLVLSGHALSMLYLNWRHGKPEHRHAIGWIFLGTAGMAALWMAALAIVGLFMLFRWHLVGDGGPTSRWLQGAIALAGPPLIALTFVAALWASIVHHGSFDPGMALRRGTGYAVLGIVMTALFVALEGALSSLVVVHLGMPSESGPVLAGTAVALGFGPLRQRVDRGVERVVQRLLPPESLAAGERREYAIAFSDLSGYTRLSEIDEAEAMTLAAILHRNARIAADRHGGRVVKTIGDAVMSVFPDASSGLSAVVALHGGYGAESAGRDSDALPIHSGLHVGEVVIAPDGDVFGASVNLAARLQTLAGPDDLVASSTMADAIAAAALTSESLPGRRFKNIAEPVDCLRVRLG